MNDASQRIEERIDRQIGGAIALHAAPGNLMTIAPTNMAELFEFAKMMAVAGDCIRPIFRNKPGACLAIALQAFRTGADPFAVANKAYLVNDQIAYEAQYIHAVINTSGQLKRRLRPTYEGEGPHRRCKIVGEIVGEDEPFEYITPAFSAIPVKNSPLWKNDPDQQLFYYASRAWARRHLPEVILGMDTGGDIESQMRDVTPPPRPTREQFEVSADEHRATESLDPAKFAESDEIEGDVPLYDVVDCDGETAVCTANTVDENMRAVFAEAQRRGMQAIDAALKNNEATVTALSEAGEHAIAGPLFIELAQMRGLVTQSKRNAERAEVVDPEPKPSQEADGVPLTEAGSSSEAKARPTEAAHPRQVSPTPKAAVAAPQGISQNPADQQPVRSPAATPPPRGAPSSAAKGHGASPASSESASLASGSSGSVRFNEPDEPQAEPLSVPPLFEKDGAIAYRAWWLGRFSNRVRQAKAPEEIDELCAANGETIQGYYATLSPAGLIAAKKELDDAKKELAK